jgi:hypothetical protein
MIVVRIAAAHSRTGSKLDILRIGLPLRGKASVREWLYGEARVHDSGRFWRILQVIWRVALVTGMEKWDRVPLVETARQRAGLAIRNQIYPNVQSLVYH